MDKATLNKYIDAVIKKMKAANADIFAIDAALEKRGVSKEDRKVIINIAIKEIAKGDEDSSKNAATGNFFETYSPKDKKLDETSYNSYQKSGESRLSQEEQDYLDELKCIAKGNSKLNQAKSAETFTTKTASTWSLIKESLKEAPRNILPTIAITSFWAVFAVIIIFAVFSLVVLVSGKGSEKDAAIMIVVALSYLAMFTSYNVSLLRFFSKKDGIWGAIQYGLRNIFCIVITTILAWIIPLFIISILRALFVVDGDVIFVVVLILLPVLFVVVVYILLLYYFIAAVMANEEEFYFEAIGRSVSYAKGRTLVLLRKLFAYLLIFLGFVILISLVFSAIAFTINYFVQGVIFKIMAYMTLISIAGVLIGVVMMIAYYVVWQLFNQKLYDNFAATCSDTDHEISKRHKIAIVVALVFIVVASIAALFIPDTYKERFSSLYQKELASEEYSGGGEFVDSAQMVDGNNYSPEASGQEQASINPFVELNLITIKQMRDSLNPEGEYYGFFDVNYVRETFDNNYKQYTTTSNFEQAREVFSQLNLKDESARDADKVLFESNPEAYKALMLTFVEECKNLEKDLNKAAKSGK